MWNNYTSETSDSRQFTAVTYMIGSYGSDLICGVMYEAFNTLDVHSSIDPNNLGNSYYNITGHWRGVISLVVFFS